MALLTRPTSGKPAYAHLLTLVEEFDRYARSVYPEGELDVDQVAEVRNAFMAGCCLAYTSDLDYAAEIKGYFNVLSAAIEAYGPDRVAINDALEKRMDAYRRSWKAAN